MKNIFLLGATGSIGSQVLEVIRERRKSFKLISISVGKNIIKTIEIINEFQPLYVSCCEENDSKKLQELFPHIEVGFGEEGLIKAATYSDFSGVLVNAVVTSVGLKPTIEAIKKKRDILLANKETLVIAGPIIKKLIKEYNVKLIPIDSEHSAIFKSIKGSSKKDVKKILITASGGAFREKTRQELENVTIEEALKHPNWKMGDKITIDCATMVNKGLEVIEAHYLFDIEYENIEVVLHKESIIHSMVEFNDNSIICEAYNPSMIIPIQYALYYPYKKSIKNINEIDFDLIRTLNFSKIDFNRYPILKIAYDMGKIGGMALVIFNASNEAAVDLFLKEKIKFLDIERIIIENTKKVEQYKNRNYLDIEEILNVNEEIKKEIYNKYEVI